MKNEFKNDIIMYRKKNYTEVLYTIILKKNSDMYYFYENSTRKIINNSFVCNVHKDVFKFNDFNEHELENSLVLYPVINRDIGIRIKYSNSLPSNIKLYISSILKQ